MLSPGSVDQSCWATCCESMLGSLSLQSFLIFLLEKEVGVGEQRGLVFLQSFEPESKWFSFELVEEMWVKR